ncbi:MAG: phytanoyl-CoA dioxygenase family protein [Abitibacteriaceae bacterium]|nr:phytanoyl-CoA dioxygenase family protein [Abditibacteriaceae bacterium]MBV9868635.1 phytanoyl-CoA dioxygenase family protein [Abditibacteriaceae bacterium]
MKLSPQEIETQALNPETLQLALQCMKVNGYVVFEEVLPKDLVAGLHQEFMQVFEEHRARTDSNRGNNRYQMHLPFRDPFNHEAVITNPLALAVIDEMLGQDAVCHYFASDTPLPGSDYQKVHSDIHLLFPETSLALPAYSIVVNIPLVDFREDNGPVEIWPGGTHLMPGAMNIQELAPLMHSETVLMPAGSLLIRDMRMWHRGTPNRSDEARPNMALIYSRHWLKTHYPSIAISAGAYEGLSERGKRLFRFEKIT